MPRFGYRAVNGAGRVVAGEMEAPDRQGLLLRLQAERIYPLEISEAGEQPAERRVWQRRRVTGRDVQLFTEQLARLLQAGLELDRCLEILTQLAPTPRFREVLAGVRQHVRGGSTFAAALGRYPEVFSRFYVSMVTAGEAGGALELILARVAQFLARVQELRGFLISSLIYPTILVTFSGAAIAVLLLWVIPQFSTIFSQTGQALPVQTQVLLLLSSLLSRYWWVLLGGAIMTAVALRQAVVSPRGRVLWHQWILRLPFLGSVLLRVEVARFCQTFGTLLTSGVPVLQALTIVKGTVSNEVVTKALDPVTEGVRKGAGLATPLAASGVFPLLAIHMITVGEETGRLEEMLIRVAEIYDEEVREAIRRGMALVEPVMIVLMACVVGFIVLSMLSAIFSINELPL